SQQQRELDEYLEILWHLHEKHGTDIKKFLNDINSDWDPSISEALKQRGLVEETPSEIKFTPKGERIARQLIRSHRLAERLLTDILNLKIEQAEAGACEFEHIVIPSIVDGICTLLGHPKVCPHGLPIPEGQCCREARHSVDTATQKITELNTGQQAKVAYINTQSNPRMHQLTQLGIKPGVTIRIHQKYPVLVVRINSTQIALDENVAKDILVWHEENSS
ncbi:MAG: metal-dependent transcriptional regulator, partial [bacterium]|nr:metal-dependent transcriptional regulator [bacterium]